MILYLDASALVKLYVKEAGTEEVIKAVLDARHVGTAQVTKVEVPSALMKLSRLRVLERDTAQASLRMFLEQWLDFESIALTDDILERAIRLLIHYPLRGFDAVHLASALAWQDWIGHPVAFATFDKQLWRAAAKTSLQPFPENLL